MSAVLVSCGGDEPVIPVVAVEASDFSFSLPDAIVGGLTGFQFTNNGQESHHMQILKLKPGVSRDQFSGMIDQVIQALPEEGEAAFGRLFAVSTAAGGPAPVGPGGKVNVVVDLDQGGYTLVCFVAGADGVPHILKGMLKSLTVGARPDDQPPEPRTDEEVILVDFAFTGVPTSLSAGKTTFKVINAGQEPHEMTIFRLKDISAAQLRDILMARADRAAGPPPFEEAGGFQAMMPGDSGWVRVDLTSGEYGLVCFIPSQSNQGAPHFALGMVSSLTVN